MIEKSALLIKIEHCQVHTVKFCAPIFYKNYMESIRNSFLDEDIKKDCIEVLAALINSSLVHREILRELKESVRADERSLY